MPEGHYFGQRLSYDGHLSTVRYVGTVKNQKGDWLGVEWDDPSRGKHDGSHGEYRYFTCISGHPRAGSFVRPSRPSDQPLSFVDALKKKYASKKDSEGSGVEKEIRISGKTVEEVGFEKKRRQLAVLQNLKVAVLDGLCIAGVESTPQEEDILRLWSLPPLSTSGTSPKKPTISLLDLSRNLLERWVDVESICSELKSLRTLQVNGNRFRDLNRQLYEDGESPFQEVRHLGLDNTLLLWDQVVELTSSFGSLHTLSLTSNGLGHDPIRSTLRTSNLITLDLSFNAIRSLGSIACLSSLPNLTTLSLRSNPLTTLSPAKFSALKTLDVANTLLPNLSSLDPIPAVVPPLVSLLTKNTPLANYESASLHTIARVPGITELNYETITPEKRLNAELFYLGFVAKQLAAAPEHWEEKAVLDEHPRYKDLCDLYGEPAIVKKKAEEADAGTLRARVTEFTFYMTESDLQIAQQQAKDIAHLQAQDIGNKSEQKKQQAPNFNANKAQTAREENANLASTTPNPSYSRPQIIDKTHLIPRTVDIYKLKGIVCNLFSIPFVSCKLIWETDEFDPVGGEDEEGWSVSEDESDSEEREKRKREKKEDKSRWARREMELTDGTREVGFWVEGPKARVRVELR